MAYRFTNTDKWSDAWFSELKPIQKLLFIYLCDNCDIAGFIEFTKKKFAFELGLKESEILGAIEGLNRGLIFSKSNDCIYIRNFLKHQKNLPLNSNNNAHLGIIKRFENYKNKFDIDNIDNFINQTIEPLPRGLGKGNGNGEGNDKSKFKIDFDIFWNLYDKKIEAKKCEIKWNKLSLETQKKIIEYIPKYKEANTEKQFRKNPDTFLNNECWNDEIITKKINQTNNSITNAKKRNNVDTAAKLAGGYGEL